MTISRKLQVKRLRHLRSVLTRVKKSRKHSMFNMSVWGKVPIKMLKKLKFADAVVRTPEYVEENQCGFAACALGWAASNPTFNRDGLRLVHDEGGFMHVEYRDSTDTEAGVKFFGLDWDEAAYLFHPNQYYEYENKKIPITAVIARIDRAIEQRL